MIIFENVSLDMRKLIPSSLLCDIACFVFYDKHPRDEKTIDITVCTKNGELREYSQRDLQYSLNLNCVINKPCDIKIIRNKNSELFYLLSAKDELFIISSIANLQVHRKLTNVDRYDVSDTACSGEARLRVLRKDDAVPLLFNSNFECLEERGVTLSPQHAEHSYPILNELKRKLVEARYSTKCNEITYAQHLCLRQKVTLLSCQNHQSPSDSSVFHNNIKSVSGALKLKTHKSWAKVCNKKLIIIFNIVIEYQKPVEKIHVLLHNAALPSLTYTTKIFTKVPTPPHWREALTTTLHPGQECAVAAVLDLEELNEHVPSRVELSGSIAYGAPHQEALIPFDDVVISTEEMMGDELDVLSSRTSDPNSVIAVLAATDKTELYLSHIKEDDEPDVCIPDLFCTHLQMERVGNAPNVIVYRKSPHHALGGALLVFHGARSGTAVRVSVHARSASQVVALLRCALGAAPARLAPAPAPAPAPSPAPSPGSTAASVLSRAAAVLEHLDRSMSKMNESKDPAIQSKLGSHIDLFACGARALLLLRERLRREAGAGLRPAGCAAGQEAHSMDEDTFLM